MKKVNIAISVETHTKAKLISILKHTTLNEYLQQAIDAAVAKDEDLVKALVDKKIPRTGGGGNRE